MKRGLILLSLAASTTYGADRKYTVIDITPTFFGTAQTRAVAISDSGYVVFLSGNKSYLWNQNSTVFSLGWMPYGTTPALAKSVNSSGMVAGEGYQYSTTVGFLWTDSSGYRTLVPLQGGYASWAVSLNASGVACGTSINNWGLERPVYWDTSGVPHDLGVEPAWTHSGYASCVNNIGTIGFNIVQSGTSWSYLWNSQSGRTALPMPEGNGYPSAVNDSGEVVGQSGSNQYFWDASLSFFRLNPLSGFSSCKVADINNRGTVVGQSFGAGTSVTVWERGQSPFDLNSHIDSATSDAWTRLYEAGGINEAGVVVGTGLRNTSSGLTERAFVAIPIPSIDSFKPSTWSLYRGQVVSGGDLSFILNKDGSYMVTKPGLTLNQSEEPVQLIVDGTCPQANVTELHCKATLGVNTPGLQVETFLYNWTTGSYDKLNEQNVTLADMDLDINAPNPSSFIRNNDRLVRMKLAIKSVGPVTNPAWQARFDVTSWSVLLP